MSDYKHLPECKMQFAPIDVCGCEVKILKQHIAKLEEQLRTMKAQRNTAYGYGQDGGEPPWMK